MKTIWSGSLSFGLVTIPIRLYSAIRSHTLGFRLLHTKCNTPLEFRRWCPHCKSEIDWENTVKGLEQEDGTFFVFTKETLEEFKPEKSDLLSIESFVDQEHIKPIYYEHHYYLAPDKKGIKAFLVLQKALAESGKVAIGKFIMREKEYVCTITPHESALLLSTLHYAYEIRPAKEALNLEKEPKITKKELDLAYKLINQLTTKTFNIKKYKDEYAEKLTEALKAKKKKRPKTSPTKTKKPKKKEDLVSILQESLKAPSRNEQPAYAKAKK